MQCYKCHEELKDGIRSGAFGRCLCVDCFILKHKQQPVDQMIINFNEQMQFPKIIKNTKEGKL